MKAAVSPGASLKVRRSQVKAVARNLAQLHGGKLGFIYDTALKGFSIELPEAAAIALSKNPRVDWVEEEGRLEPTTVQSNPGWDLDRIIQISLPLNAQYIYNATGSGVRAYVIDSGIRASHPNIGNDSDHESGAAAKAASFLLLVTPFAPEQKPISRSV